MPIIETQNVHKIYPNGVEANPSPKHQGGGVVERASVLL